MPYAGQTLQNPVSGESIHFRKTAAETGGQLLEFDVTLTPDGHVPGSHVHPEQEERFYVIEGSLRFRLGRKTILAGPGDTVMVPSGCVHSFKNAGNGVARARVAITPALRMGELFETTHHLAREGKVTRKGMPTPLHLALFVREYKREVRAPFPPPVIVNALMAPLVAIARARGHAARYSTTVPTLTAAPAPVSAG